MPRPAPRRHSGHKGHSGRRACVRPRAGAGRRVLRHGGAPGLRNALGLADPVDATCRQFLHRPFRVLAEPATAVLRRHRPPANLAVETAYCADRPGFERPYGCAWLLALAAELAGWDHPEAAGWADAVRPLAAVMNDDLAGWLARERYPIRHGVHGNTAFALALVWDAAPGLREVAAAAALRWYVGD